MATPAGRNLRERATFTSFHTQPRRRISPQSALTFLRKSFAYFEPKMQMASPLPWPYFSRSTSYRRDGLQP